ncbi:uncharacterized protein RSE6_05955 [Rhynchosporium secalis]|uniref:Uncharacterized protein n=1 Tax=Rhynchosporium secalis TaxID=38038 RepID=A0A1E1M958_RHYSE|nr:uncharacterized protein RSE6_05955 [Rhynchosporium secalis]
MPVWLPAISNTESTKCLQPVQHEVEKSTLQAEVCHQSHPFCDSTAFLNLTGVSNTHKLDEIYGREGKHALNSLRSHERSKLINRMVVCPIGYFKFRSLSFPRNSSDMDNNEIYLHGLEGERNPLSPRECSQNKQPIPYISSVF